MSAEAEAPRPRRSRRGRLRDIAIVVVLAVISAGCIGWPIYVRPSSDEPTKSDVIMVIAGRQDGREDYGISLAEKGFADTVLMSNPYGPNSEYMEKYCGPTPPPTSRPITIRCFQPDPDTTRGEARYLEQQAQQHNWKSAMVVTFTPHLSRARYIIDRCFSGDLKMVDYRTPLSKPYWAYMYVYQTAGWIRAALQSGC